MTKADLWRLWQDSERQLRTRLRQAEAQRDNLIRQLSRLATQDRQMNAPECHSVPEDSHLRGGRSPLRHSEEDIARGFTIQEEKPILPSVVERHEEIDRENNLRIRLTEQYKRPRPAEEVRKKNSKGGDVSFTPRGRKRHRIKQKDNLPLHSSEPTRNVDTDDQFTQHRYSNRGAYSDGVERSKSSEDLNTTPRRRIKTGRGTDNVGIREPPEGFSGCSLTPLPLLRSLHQHTRTEKSYGSVQPSRESPHLGQTLGNEMLEKDADVILQDQERYKDIDHRRRREEGGGPRRRRITSHPITSYSEGHYRRRSRDRHTARDQSEGRGRREQERDPRYSGVRKSRERDSRDASCGTLSGISISSHKQHGVRRRTSYESSSEYEEIRLRTDTSTPTEITLDRRQSMQQPVLRGYETLRTGSGVSSDRSVSETRETGDPP